MERLRRYWDQVIEDLRKKKKTWFQYWDDCCKEWGDDEIFCQLRNVDIQRAFWLHPQFVDATHDQGSPLAFASAKVDHNSVENKEAPNAVLCGACSRVVCRFPGYKDTPDLTESQCKAFRPLNSIAAGLDFGNARRMGLRPLSWLEIQCIAFVRMYLAVLKFSGANAGKGEQSTMRGHCISFEQPEGPDVTYAAFEWNMSLHDKISISFVGSQGQFEHRLKAAMPFGTMLMALNVTLMMQYIRFFRAIERAGYDKAVLPGDGGGRTVDWELMKRYFGGGAKDDGSLLKRLLNLV